MVVLKKSGESICDSVSHTEDSEDKSRHDTGGDPIPREPSDMSPEELPQNEPTNVIAVSESGPEKNSSGHSSNIVLYYYY